MRDLPAAVRAKARDAGAKSWLEDLPGLIDGLAREWGVRLGEAFKDATEAYVVSVTRSDGRPAVLKLPIPRPGLAESEIEFLSLVAGEGCCRLLEVDRSRNAMLLERLGPAMSDLDLPVRQRLEILCDLAASIWRPATAFPTGATRAAKMSIFIRHKWTDLGEPCTRRAMEQAVAAAESRRLAHDPSRAVLIHGDVHQWNALRSGDGFKLVDPDGLVAEPECDLGVLMREDPVELLEEGPWSRCAWLAARTGTDPRAIWEWGLADRVTTGLVLTVAGVQPVAAQMLRAADEISRSA
jgi:streptomycin 6-kinase